MCRCCGMRTYNPCRYKKSPAQVSLRFLLDKGIAVIPSAHTADYMIENLAVHTTAVRAQSERELLPLLPTKNLPLATNMSLLCTGFFWGRMVSPGDSPQKSSQHSPKSQPLAVEIKHSV